MHSTHHRIDSAAAALWASAFVIAAMIIVQAGRLPLNPAYAEMTSTRSSYSIMSANGGRGDDADPDEVLYVIDNRSEVLLVYEVADVRTGAVVPRDGGALPPLFRNAVRR
jgi:hypothetical protein